jgi:hypothetical protein
MSLEWARARALENAARLEVTAEARSRAQVVQHPIGSLLCWRPRPDAPPSARVSLLGESAPLGGARGALASGRRE